MTTGQLVAGGNQATLQAGKFVQWQLAPNTAFNITSDSKVYVVTVLLQADTSLDVSVSGVVPQGQYIPQSPLGVTVSQGQVSVTIVTSHSAALLYDDTSVTWVWAGITPQYTAITPDAGYHLISHTAATNVSLVYYTSTSATGALCRNAIAFRMAPLWESCKETSETRADGLDNDCDGRIDEELLNNVDDDGDGRVDEDCVTGTLTFTKTVEKKSGNKMMLIILGATLGGIPVIILAYLIARALFCPVQSDKVEVIGSKEHLTASQHDLGQH